MKPINHNRKIIFTNSKQSLRPYSVNDFFRKGYKSPINPSDENNSQSHFNKDIFNNNHTDNNNLIEINSYINQRMTTYGHNDNINERSIPNNKQKYDNLNVKIYNLYNIKDKNKPFSIKINNNSPKYYINNCVNPFLVKKLNTEKRNKNVESYKDEKINNNMNNNKYIFSLVSPKCKVYKKINFQNKTSENIINSNKIKKIDENRISNINQKKKKKKLILDKYNDYSFNIIKHKKYANIRDYKSIVNEKNIDVINNTQIDNFGEYFLNSGHKNKKYLDAKSITNTNQKKINTRVINSHLTLESPKIVVDNFNNPRKNNKINNTQFIQFIPSNQNNKINNSTKKDLQRINNKKENRVFTSFFDLKNNKFESETIKKIIKEFFDKEEKESEKNKLNDKNNKKNCNVIKKKIPRQKQKFQKYIKENATIKIPKNIKKITNNDYEIYLQYNQNNCVEKILLNDKNGNITSFIPSKDNDKFNTIDNINL